MKTNSLVLILAIFFLFSCKSSEEKASAQLVQQAGLQFAQDSLPQSEAEWKALLSPEQYRVLRQKGTERAFTGHLLKNKKKGIYTCGGCGLELFHSSTKFESGTGWPSFFDVYKQGHVGLVEDRSHGMLRTEVVCNRCQGHLGHVFEDGPKPTGLRYCINSVSLSFVEED